MLISSAQLAIAMPTTSNRTSVQVSIAPMMRNATLGYADRVTVVRAFCLVSYLRALITLMQHVADAQTLLAQGVQNANSIHA